MAQDLFLIELRQRYAQELAQAETKLLEAAKELGWLLSMPEQAKSRRIDQQTYLPSKCDYTYLAHLNKKSYINLNLYNGEMIWLPVDKTWKVRRYMVSFPFGHALVWDDPMTQAELITWINRLDPYHYSHEALIELCYVLTQNTGYKYNFFGNHNHPWEFTVL